MIDKYIKKVLLIVCIILSVLAMYKFGRDRWIGHEIVPENGIFDERDYALQGYSLRKTGIPIGWSTLPGYDNMPDSNIGIKLDGFSILANGIKPNLSNFKNFPKPLVSINQFDVGLGMQHTRLVQPFIDHPPLGGLIYSLAIPDTAKGFLDIKPEYYRKVSQVLALITSVLIFVLAYQVFKNPLVSLLSLLVYNSAPMYSLISRYSLLENIVAPFSLSIIILLLMFFKFKGRRKLSLFILFLSGLISGLTILVKETGIAFVLAGVIILFLNKSGWRNIFIFLGAAALPIVCYLAYCLYYFPKLFWDIAILNTTRGFSGSLNFISIFSSMKVNNFSLDGWWIWGFIAMIFLSIYGGRKSWYITIPFATHLLIVLFFSGLNYPWYYFALVPYLAIGSGYALWKMLFSPNPALVASFFLLPFSSSFYWGFTTIHPHLNSVFYRIGLLFITCVVATRLIFTKNKWINYTWLAFMIILLITVFVWNSSSILYIIANRGVDIIPKMSTI